MFFAGAIAEHIVAQQLQVLLDGQYISDLHFGYVTSKAPMLKQILYGKREHRLFRLK